MTRFVRDQSISSEEFYPFDTPVKQNGSESGQKIVHGAKDDYSEIPIFDLFEHNPVHKVLSSGKLMLTRDFLNRVEPLLKENPFSQINDGRKKLQSKAVIFRDQPKHALVINPEE